MLNMYAKIHKDPTTESTTKIRRTESAIFLWSFHYFASYSFPLFLGDDPGRNLKNPVNVPEEDPELNMYA